MSSVYDKLIQRLTNNYAKDPNSNIGKILQLLAYPLQEHQDTRDKIEEYRDIDLAEGVTLDRIGGNVQQPRGQANDAIYRIMLKAKIKANLSDGTINTVIDYISFILQIDPSEVEVHETWEDNVGKYANLHINVPTKPINEIGLSLNQFAQLVRNVLAAGVGCSVLAEGTFQFSSISNQSETDTEKGFSDVDGTTGGFFGAIYDSGQEQKLPI